MTTSIARAIDYDRHITYFFFRNNASLLKINVKTEELVEVETKEKRDHIPLMILIRLFRS